jgi:hypothetical protein
MMGNGVYPVKFVKAVEIVQVVEVVRIVESVKVGKTVSRKKIITKTPQLNTLRCHFVPQLNSRDSSRIQRGRRKDESTKNTLAK